jgi:hypothetical protein
MRLIRYWTKLLDQYYYWYCSGQIIAFSTNSKNVQISCYVHTIIIYWVFLTARSQRLRCLIIIRGQIRDYWLPRRGWIQILRSRVTNILGLQPFFSNHVLRLCGNFWYCLYWWNIPLDFGSRSWTLLTRRQHLVTTWINTTHRDRKSAFRENRIWHRRQWILRKWWRFLDRLTRALIYKTMSNGPFLRRWTWQPSLI